MADSKTDHPAQAGADDSEALRLLLLVMDSYYIPWDNDTGDCLFCGAMPYKNGRYVGPDAVEHTEGCEWAAARDFLLPRGWTPPRG